MLEAVDGKIFDRYPGLFKVTTINRTSTGDDTSKEFDFYVVPLHLKAKEEGSKRRILASRILAVAIDTMIREYNTDADWVLGGDFNATLASGDFAHLSQLQAISAQDEEEGAITYIKGRFKSLIDHVFVSPNLAKMADEDDFFIVAKDKTLPDYTAISDHRPVLIRLSLKEVDTDEGANHEEDTVNSDMDVDELIKRLITLQTKHKEDSSNGAPYGSKKVAAPKQVKSSYTEKDSLKTALAALERNQNRVYYDEEADKRAIKNYYGQLPSGASSEQLFDFFSQLAQRTHRKKLPYKPAVHLYPWVDLQPDKQTLRSIYSGQDADPEAFIRADFEAETLRAEKIKELEQLHKYNFESDSDLRPQLNNSS